MCHHMYTILMTYLPCCLSSLAFKRTTKDVKSAQEIIMHCCKCRIKISWQHSPNLGSVDR